MQAGKSAMSSVMEAAANVAASAKVGLDKTKAVVEEKVEKMSIDDLVERDMATLKKEEKIDLAEIRKKGAYAQNAAASMGAVSRGYTAGGDIPVGSQLQTSVVSSSTHNKPIAHFVTEDVVGSHYPVGTTTGAFQFENRSTGTGDQSHAVYPNPVPGIGSDNKAQVQTRTHAMDINGVPTAGHASQYRSETNLTSGRSSDSSTTDGVSS